MKCLVLVLLLITFACPGSATSAFKRRPIYQHAYYLFLADMPKGCEDCYIPLLITKQSIQELARSQLTEDCILIITYERDSIWQIIAPMAIKGADVVELAARRLRLRDRSYRYHEITPAEVLKLLEKPHGTIPISRPVMPQSHIDLQELISDFKSSK